MSSLYQLRVLNVLRQIPTKSSRLSSNVSCNKFIQKATAPTPEIMMFNAPKSKVLLSSGMFLSSSVAALVATSSIAECQPFCSDGAQGILDKLLAKAEAGASERQKRRSSSSGGDGNSPIDEFINKYGDQLGSITYGSVLGFCSGYAVKQVGKVAAVAVGTAFVVSQIAASAGYVDINWKQLERDLIKKFDPNCDGKITSEDLKIWWKKSMKILKYNVPSTGGFAAGFALGITYA